MPQGYHTGKQAKMLAALRVSPCSCAYLAELTGDVTKYISRDMAALIAKGVVVNLTPGKGRHALYALPVPA